MIYSVEIPDEILARWELLENSNQPNPDNIGLIMQFRIRSTIKAELLAHCNSVPGMVKVEILKQV